MELVLKTGKQRKVKRKNPTQKRLTAALKLFIKPMRRMLFHNHEVHLKFLKGSFYKQPKNRFRKHKRYGAPVEGGVP